MAKVFWDEPSEGLVNSDEPALTLYNRTDGGLLSNTTGRAIEGRSENAEAIVGETTDTLTARFKSDQNIALFANAPNAWAIIGSSQHPEVGAVVGVNAVEGGPAQKGGLGVLGTSNGFQGIGAAGYATGFRSTGVLGFASNGVGVRGEGTSGGVEGVSTTSFGVDGRSMEAAGIRGTSVAAPGVSGISGAAPGVQGQSDSAEGVVGEAQADDAAGVRGRNNATGGVGVDGFSENGIGARGISSNGTGTWAQSAKGVALHAESFGGRAAEFETFSSDEPALTVQGLGGDAITAISGLGAGIEAFGAVGVNAFSLGASDPDDDSNGCGVNGVSLTHVGVRGVTLGGVGVYGFGSPLANAWAGVFKGNVLIEGDLFTDGIQFKSASFFSIAHPLDPRRKVLNHAAVESPEYKTFYDGVATLDRRGRATVQLPKWFSALNEQCRYHLTPIGGPAPDLHIAREVKGGTFTIAGGRARQKVSWQVTGVRKDKWAKANPLRVEEPKRSRPNVAAPGLDQLRAAGRIQKERVAGLQRKRDKAKRLAARSEAPRSKAIGKASSRPQDQSTPLAARAAERVLAVTRELQVTRRRRK